MRRTPQKLGAGTIIALAAMLGLLVLAGVFLYVGWGAPNGGSPMSTGGYVAMALGTVITMALGAGLMFLMFYSNRHGRD
jgi:ammonia channel protein AmtB